MIVLAATLLAACAEPPQAAQPAPQVTPPAPAPTTVPAPAATPTLQTALTQTAAAQQTAEAGQGQLENVVTDQKVSAQQVLALQQTVAAAKQTVAAQEGQIQGVAANQVAAAQQLVAVQQTAEAAKQSLNGLQTAVANLVTAQQTAAAPRQLAPTQINSTPQSAGTPQPTGPRLLYAWFYKRPSEIPRICGPGQGNPCLDSAPNQGTQYISGHVIDQHGMPVLGIIVQAKNGSNPLFNSTDATGYYSILLYTNCPSGPQSWDVYIVDGNNNLSSYVKTITYTNCTQAGEFHIDFVEAAHS